MTDNIVAMPTPMNVRADRIREASRKRTEGREAWIEWTVKLAIELAAACNTFSSDRAFNIWLAENDLGKDNLTENDRAALIQMGRHPDQLYEELCECDRELAPVTIWRKAQTRFGQLSKPNDPTPQAAEINIPPPTTPTPSTPTCAENKQPVQPPLPTPRHALVGSGNDLLYQIPLIRTRGSIGAVRWT